MIVLVIFAFIAGLVTILSPCILPLLPIILSTSASGDVEDKKRPLGVVIGFILSFTFFTLFLSSLVQLFGIQPDVMRGLSIFLIAVFGLSLLSPKFQTKMETWFSKLTRFTPNSAEKTGFGGGLVIGLSLGLLWTPCVGPILASVVSLAIIGEVSLSAVIITLAYSLGTAIPMFLIMRGGNLALKKVPWLTKNLGKIQKGFGVLMLATALMIYFNLDRKFQTFILDTFPSYGTGLTKFEENSAVQQELDRLSGEDAGVYGVNKNESRNEKSVIKTEAPELILGGRWINSEPLTLEELKGKVVLIDFWTYTCINCQRTFPYLRDWWEKYKDEGLVIIGVHAPEFEFEKDYENVLEASVDFDLQHPIMQDNDFRTWRAYNNRYWPAKYLIDKDGYIRYTHFGEGKYDETEKMIQELLKEAGSEVNEKISNANYSNYSQTPETYLGYKRIKGFASNERLKQNSRIQYTHPNELAPKTFSFEGKWLVSEEYANPLEGSTLRFSFNSKNVFLVMRSNEEISIVKVYLDGEYQKDVEVTNDTLYTLIELEEPGAHLLELEFLDDNVEIYAFTFG